MSRSTIASAIPKTRFYCSHSKALSRRQTHYRYPFSATRNRSPLLPESTPCYFSSASIHMIFRGRAFPWIGLAVILICFVISILREHPTNYFGLTGDDAVYFSSAKALAQGQGYVLPNVPGAPPATKYPILYSWLLSWAWRVNGSFPANLREATAITVVFGLGFITLALVFLRRLAGIGNAESLFITAFCALHPRVIFFSGAVMSDIPFAALALAAKLGHQ